MPWEMQQCFSFILLLSYMYLWTTLKRWVLSWRRKNDFLLHCFWATNYFVLLSTIWAYLGFHVRYDFFKKNYIFLAQILRLVSALIHGGRGREMNRWPNIHDEAKECFFFLSIRTLLKCSALSEFRKHWTEN